MKCSKDCKWTWIAVVAAVVAAITTVVLLMLRARAKRISRHECEGCFDYEMDELDQLADAEPTQEPEANEE